MAKKGKEEGKGAKGAKKGKKEVLSDSEDVSDAEVSKSNAEESEMGSEMVEEEEEESEEDPKKKKGKDKKGAAKGGKKAAAKGGKKGVSEEEEEEDASGKKKRQIKGASKAVMGLATEDAKKKKGAKKDHAKAQLKGATKAMAMTKKEAVPPPKKKRSLKSTSKLFMGFKGAGRKRTPKKSQFKYTSRFFWGLKKHSTKRRKKKKNKGVLKSTSNLMMRFKKLGKKKKEEEKAPGTKKPSFMLIRLGGGKADGGKGGGFLSLFRKKSKPNENFRVRAQVVSKVAAATSWLTRTFLSNHCTCPSNARVTDESWLSRIGAKKLPFPSGDEVLRHRANMRKIPGRDALYSQTQEEFGYWDKLDSASPLDPYNDYREESSYDLQPSSQYGYPEEDEHYSTRNPMDDECGPAEEPVDYYDQDQYDYYNYDDHQECDPSTSYSPYEPYDDFRNGYGGARGARGPSYGETDQFGYPNGDGYSQHEVSYSEHEWPPETQASYNPYAYPLDDIAEMDETEGVAGGTGGYPFPSSRSSGLEEQGGVDDLTSKMPLNRTFRLFPRPQVKLFGKDKLDVTLPPSPHLPFGSWDPEEEEEEEREDESEPLISPFAQFDDQNLDLPRPPGAFSKLLPGCFVSKLQRPRSTNPARRNFGREMGPSNPGISPREFGSPLGQFLQQSLTQPKPILKHRRSGGPSSPPTPAPMRRGPPSPSVERRPTRPASPQLPIPRHFEMPSSDPSPKSARRFGAPPSSHPSARLRDALHEELHHTLPFLGSPSSKKPHQGIGAPMRKPVPTATINKSSPQLSQRQNPSSSLRSLGSNQRSQPTGRSPLQSSSFQASSSPQPTARKPFASKRNPSSLSLKSLPSLKMGVPFSRSLFHVPHTPDPSEFQDFPLNGTPGRYTPTGFRNAPAGSLRAPSSPQMSLRQSGSPPRPAPNPFRPPRRIDNFSVDPAGRLPQAWNRQNEPPTKAVKPLMRDQYMRQFIPRSPVLSARGSSRMPARQGSRRVTIQESPIESSPYAQPFDEADGSAEALWWQQEGWDYPSRNGVTPPWNPSSKGAAPGSLRSVSNLPRHPPSPPPGSRKAFLQRIGQPLAGMAQPNFSFDMEDGNPYRAQFGQSPGPSPALSRHPFMQESFAEAQMGGGGYSRSPSPNMGRKFSAGNLPYGVSGGGPGNLGRLDLSPVSQRAYSFKGSRARGRGSPSMAHRPPPQDQYDRPRRPDLAHFPDELLEHEMEDGMGRYAVVTPQVQRMGSSFRRPPHGQNEPWSGYHTVNVHEMPSEWAPEKLFQRPPTGGSKRRGSRRKGSSSLFWYLTRGSSAHNQEYGGSNRSWQCKVIQGVPGSRGWWLPWQLGWGVRSGF